MVASVGRITAGRGYDYLTREVATSKHDYYTGKGETPGVWTGRGAALLGLSGAVGADDMAGVAGSASADARDRRCPHEPDLALLDPSRRGPRDLRGARSAMASGPRPHTDRFERAKMHDKATIRSGHRKARGDVVDLHERWQLDTPDDELAALAAVVSDGADVSDGGPLRAGSTQLAERVFAELHEQQAWWTRAHVTGEVARLIANPTLEAIEVETERIIAMCVPLEVDDDAECADVGASKYTSTTIQTAEQRILTTATEDRATFAMDTVRDAMLGDDQVAAVDEIVGGGGRISTVVGPAGAGKTTMLRSVAATCDAARRNVIVLTLSAAAARVVTDETGLPANTIAGWRVGAVDTPRGGVVAATRRRWCQRSCSIK